MELVGYAINFVSIVELANRLYDTLKQLAAAQAPSAVFASLTEKASELKNEIYSLKEEGLESLDPQLRTVDDLLQKIQNSITCSQDRPFWRKAFDKIRRSPDISAMLNELDGLVGRLNKDISKLLTKSNYIAGPKFREYVPDLTPPPVGLDRVQPILSFLEEKEEGVEVRAVAIHGEGGLGKTTLLRWALNKLREKTNELKFVYVEFEREPDEEKAIKSKQSSIIQQILEESEPVKLPSSAHGRDGIKQQLRLMMKRKRRICLAIDDVWKKADLQNLLPSDLGSHLPPSSYILLTTRSLDVVDELYWLCKPEAAASTSTQDAASSRTQNEEKRCKILRYRPEDLSKKDARELFVRHAHISPSAENGVELADEVVKLCRGLPLALQVLGGHFSSEKRRKRWKDTFQRMDLTHESLKEPRTEIMGKILRGSYKSLKSDKQKAFLDVACFFEGWNWETVSAIVGFNELDMLNTLCFVKQVDQADAHCFRSWVRPEDDRVFTCGKIVKMHPLLVELGRCEAQRSRVRSPPSVLKDYEELQKIEGLWDSSRENAVGADVLKRMKSLRVARIAVDDEFPPPMKLVYLDLLETYKRSLRLPSMQRCKQLSVLTLREIRSRFDGVEFPDGLRQLRLVHCSSLDELPSSFGRPGSMLEILHITGCSSLNSLPDTICELRRLRELVVQNCNSFVKLTTSSMLTNLAELQCLSLIDCDNLTDLPKEIWGIKNLTQVRLSRLNVIIPSVSYLSSLKILSVSGVKSLELSADCDIWKLHSLRELRLQAYKNMKNIPKEVEELKALGGLEALDLSKCTELQELPDSVGQLKGLEHLWMRYCSEISELPESMSNLTSLSMLDLRGCEKLTGLPAGIGNLSALTHLDLCGCEKLRGLPKGIVDLSSLQILNLSGCKELTGLPADIANLSSLEMLYLRGCLKLTRLPAVIGNLSSLEMLCLSGCEELTGLPAVIGNLSSLEELYLSGCEKLTGLPEEIGNLGSLKQLYLDGCQELTELPAGIGKLKNLQTLVLSYCSKLRKLPDLTEATSLEFLCLQGCGVRRSYRKRQDECMQILLEAIKFEGEGRRRARKKQRMCDASS